MASSTPTLSPAQARQLALKAQNLWSRPKGSHTGESVHTLTRHLGAVQLDTISVLTRSHELVAFARLGAMPKSEVEAGYWHRPGTPATHFEYWSHAACILPIESWPLFEFRRAAYRDRGWRWHEVDQKVVRKVKKQLRDNGPMTTSDLGGGRKDAYWWNWSDVKVGVEYLLDIGEVVVSSRDKWRRVYDLSERVVPEQLLEPIDFKTAHRQLLLNSLETLGFGTKNDILDIHRLKPTHQLTKAAWTELLDSDDVTEVRVNGSDEVHYALKAHLEGLDKTKPQRTVMLSPFDSLVWYRPRLERLFGMEYRIEAYTPNAQRKYGYFAMPVLVGDKLVARVDPGRQGKTLLAKTVTFQSAAPTEQEIRGVFDALVEAASWVGSTAIEIGNVQPAKAGKLLLQLAKGFAVK